MTVRTCPPTPPLGVCPGTLSLLFPPQRGKKVQRLTTSLPPSAPNVAGVCACWKWFLFVEGGSVARTQNLSKESMPQASSHINEKTILSLVHRWLVLKIKSFLGEKLGSGYGLGAVDIKRHLAPFPSSPGQACRTCCLGDERIWTPFLPHTSPPPSPLHFCSLSSFPLRLFALVSWIPKGHC